MNRIPSGLPDDRPQFDMSKYFKVIQRESSIKDENLNEKIQNDGVHFSGEGSETDWYQTHKGYSELTYKSSNHSELPRE